MPRIVVTLSADEREALCVLAQQERRDPRAQAALMILRELERTHLLLPADQQHTQTTSQAEELPPQ